MDKKSYHKSRELEGLKPSQDKAAENRKKAKLHEAKMSALKKTGVSGKMIHQRPDLKHESIRERETITRLSKHSKNPKMANKDFFELHKEKEKQSYLKGKEEEKERHLKKAYGIA